MQSLLRSSCLRIGFACCLPMLASAKPIERTADAEILVEQQQYDRALALYDRAALSTAEPSLIAYNRGVVLLKMNRLAEAELAFRQSVESATLPNRRHYRGFYNLGICLLKRADAKDVARLKAAVECFERCEELNEDDAELKEDTSANLQIAQALYAEAKRIAPKPSPPERDSGPSNDNPPNKPQLPDREEASKAGSDEGSRNSAPGSGDAQASDRKPLPGAGSLPVLLDDEELQPLSADETKALLQKADGRLRGERQRVREGAAQNDKPRPHNW